jgi:hypothetical protein
MLLPVTVSDDAKLAEREAVASASGGAIHIELPNGARISLEGGIDPAVVRVVLESLRT